MIRSGFISIEIGVQTCSRSDLMRSTGCYLSALASISGVFFFFTHSDILDLSLGSQLMVSLNVLYITYIGLDSYSDSTTAGPHSK